MGLASVFVVLVGGEREREKEERKSSVSLFVSFSFSFSLARSLKKEKKKLHSPPPPLFVPSPRGRQRLQGGIVLPLGVVEPLLLAGDVAQGQVHV